MNVDTEFFCRNLLRNFDFLCFLIELLVILTNEEGAEHLTDNRITWIVSKSHIMPFWLWDIFRLLNS